MTTRKKQSKTAPKRIPTQFRFFDTAHHSLVTRAAKRAGLSINAWIAQATLERARTELAK